MPAWVSLHLWRLVPESQKGTSDALNIDLSVAVPYHVGAGNRTGVLCKSK